MIVFVTTADTEILALSRVARNLPEGFPALKAVNPTRLPSDLGPAELATGAVMVLVRLLGGRRAWEEGFDALVRYCRQQRSEEHTSELQSLTNLVCRLLLEQKNHTQITTQHCLSTSTLRHQRTAIP